MMVAKYIYIAVHVVQVQSLISDGALPMLMQCMHFLGN